MRLLHYAIYTTYDINGIEDIGCVHSKDINELKQSLLDICKEEYFGENNPMDEYHHDEHEINQMNIDEALDYFENETEFRFEIRDIFVN